MKKVIIIGAGLAGITAALELFNSGVDVIVLESSSRVGGRICKSEDLSVPVDLGASWIHRINGNPLSDTAKLLNLKLDVTSNPNLTGEQSFEVFDSDGRKFDPKCEQKVRDKFALLSEKGVEILKTMKGGDISVEKMFELAHTELPVSTPAENPHEVRLMNWLKSGIEGWENTTLDKLSAKNHFFETDQDIFNGPDAFVVSGFYNIVEHMAKPLIDAKRILCNQIVEKVVYSDTSVCVKTKTDVFVGDHCISTLPLGVLKAGSVSFWPPLPESKKQSIDKLGFGVMNKLVFEFKECFWNPTAEGIGFANSDHGEFTFFLNLYPLLKKPILMCFVTGDFARKVEFMEDEKIVRKVMKVLNKVYGNLHPEPKPKLQDPIGVAVTRWFSNPSARGSYSFMKVGSSLEDVNKLAEPVGRLHFAGEATFAYPGYTHGAYLSGKREAQRILKVASVSTSKKTPTTLVNNSSPALQLSAKL